MPRLASITSQTLAGIGITRTSIPTWSLAHTLDDPNTFGTSDSDSFGDAVAISGNYAIVSARTEESNSGLNASGKTFIYDVTTGNLVHDLDNPNAFNFQTGDVFGEAVAIDGNYAIVSAIVEDDAGGVSSGKAYIFNVTTGSLVHTLDNPNAYGTSADDRFGKAVGISGNYAIVSTRDEDDAGGTRSGKAYIFNVTTGSLVHTLDNPNAYGTSLDDRFGHSAAISGNYAIVGAPFEDDANGNSSGKAYIFDVTTGNLLHTLDNPNPYGGPAIGSDDLFGWSVGISGNNAIVGAYNEDEPAGFNSGKAYIFDVTTGNLLHTLNNPNAYNTVSDDVFGISVAISSTYAIVGAQGEDDAGGTQSGKAYIFDVATGSLVDTLDNPNAYGTSGSDIFGEAVAISGTNIIVGALLEDDAPGGTGNGNLAGKAYIFTAS